MSAARLIQDNLFIATTKTMNTIFIKNSKDLFLMISCSNKSIKIPANMIGIK
jgi:hypothetical protein